MSNDGYRRVCLHGVLVILLGLLIAGFPLVWVVTRDVYHQPVPVHLPGDYRAWLMAHLEGILNGLLVIALAATCRAAPMRAGFERVLVWSLIVTAWGNVIASIAAPLYQVRAMVFDANVANNVLTGVFTIALVATLVAFGMTIAHLARRLPDSQL